MKKFFSMFIAIMCLFTCMVCAEDSKSTEVTFTVGQSFDWTVPANLTLSEGTPKSDTITVTKNVIPQGAKLVIKLSDTNSFELRSTEGATRTYTITKGGTAVNAGDTILEVEAGSTGSKTLSFAVESVSGKKSGTFKGTANFTASVKEPPLYNMVTDADSNGVISKGDIISLNGVDLGSTSTTGGSDSTTDTFRVLSVDGTNVKLLAMDSYKTVNFNGPADNTYSGSTLDTEMTNYYNALPSNVQNAIVAQDISQGTYSRKTSSTGSDVLHITNLNSNNSYYANTKTVNVGNRNVFALDIQDIIDYLDSDITGAQLNELFFNTTESVSRYVWLRSASASSTFDAFYVYGYEGSLVYSDEISYDYYEVRPAFVINLD